MNQALKEWAVAVDALGRGETIMLLRKGGIREEGGRFSVAYRRVWLYPTYEHQQPHLLKPHYADKVQPVASGWHPATVSLDAWAEITDVIQVSEAVVLNALLPLHIWNEQFVTERLRWKPRQPLYVLLLRVYKLSNPEVIAYRTEYGGCKSWIELQADLEAIAPLANPVLEDHRYADLREQIQHITLAQKSI